MKFLKITSNKKNIEFSFENCTHEGLVAEIEIFFTSIGYSRKENEGDKYIFTKGNRILRMLLGAFAKYHKQSVLIASIDDIFRVSLVRESSGMSGGLIGMSQVRKEFEKLSYSFEAYFDLQAK